MRSPGAPRSARSWSSPRGDEVRRGDVLPPPLGGRGRRASALRSGRGSDLRRRRQGSQGAAGPPDITLAALSRPQRRFLRAGRAVSFRTTDGGRPNLRSLPPTADRTPSRTFRRNVSTASARCPRISLPLSWRRCWMVFSAIFGPWLVSSAISGSTLLQSGCHRVAVDRVRVRQVRRAARYGRSSLPRDDSANGGDQRWRSWLPT